MLDKVVFLWIFYAFQMLLAGGRILCLGKNLWGLEQRTMPSTYWIKVDFWGCSSSLRSIFDTLREIGGTFSILSDIKVHVIWCHSQLKANKYCFMVAWYAEESTSGWGARKMSASTGMNCSDTHGLETTRGLGMTTAFTILVFWMYLHLFLFGFIRSFYFPLLGILGVL